MYGYDSAFIGGTPALPSFKDAYGLTGASADVAASLSSNIVSTFQGGAFFGSMLGFVLGERFGRKPVLLVATCIFCIGAILRLIGQIDLLYAGRALTGVGVGATSMILPIYLSECAPPNIRGRLVGFFEVMLQTALVVGFWVNYGVNENVPRTSSNQWHIPVALQLAPADMLLLMVPFFTVESPRWLVSKGRSQDAQKALSWVRSLPEDDLYLQHELHRIENGVNEDLEVAGSGGTSTYVKIAKELFSEGVRNRLMIGTSLMVLQNMTGYANFLSK
jgi:MFS family permease